ncbi:MAG: PAS domain S-box protein [Gemmatimonadota bacterium]|nr:PAS domain S-box protein [Gemmatimonadota bacterium]
MAPQRAADRATDDRYRTLVEWSPAPLVVHRDGLVLYANPAALRLFGVPAGRDMVGTPLLDHVHPDYRALVMTRIAALLAGDVTTAELTEIRCLRLDGALIDVETHATVADYDGSPSVQVSLRDVTAHRQAQTAVRETALRLDLALRYAKAGSWDWDIVDGAIVWSHEMFELFGLDAQREAASFDAWRRVLHPDDAAGAERRLSAAIETHAVLDSDYRIVLPSGEIRWINAVGQGLYDDDGRAVRMLGLCLDITARKQAAIELRESESRFRSLVTNSPYCIHEIDLEGRLISMNAAGLAMMGVDSADAIRGMPYTATVGDGDRARVDGLLAGALAGEAASFVFRSSAGLTFQSTFVPITDDQGNVRRLMGVTIDITAQRQAEAVDAFLAQAGQSAQDEPFFQALARFLAESLQMDYICIDRLAGDALNATTLAVWYDGKFDDNLTYALYDTPCGSVVGNRVCVIPSNVCALYPNDAALQELGAESYVGVTLLDHAGKPIGLIAVIGRRALANRTHAEATLARVAPRAAGELERLMVEEELRASEAHARAVLDASPVPMALNDEAGRVTYLNPAFIATFGYTRDDCPTVADWWPRAYPDETYRAQVMEAWETEISRSTGTGTAFHPQEFEVRCKDGSDRYAVIHATSIAPSPTPQLLVVFHDVTARRRAEMARRLESAALEAVANAVVITTRDGVIVWVNSAFTASTGFTLEEAQGRQPGDLLKSGEHDAEFYSALWTAILGGDVWQGEMVNRRKDGSRYIEEMTISPLRDTSGEITHFIAVKQDITQRKALEAKLQQAQKLESVGLLAGGVAHDFNNMLGVILGNVDLALEQAESGQAVHEDLLEIRKAAVRSADLTRQLLAFARQQTIAPAVIDLNETVPNMLAMLNRLIGEDVRLVWQPAPSVWPVLMDPSQMDQILTNLVVNARHAIADVGVVTIATNNSVLDPAFCAAHADATPGEYVRLSVHDTGSGMDDATQARIFEPFFSTKGVGAGTGLGLATVYGAVKQNQGVITVQSVVGGGTTFDVLLPRHRGSPTPAHAAIVAAGDLRGGETILLVEDEPAVRRLVSKALEGQGYRVLAAGGADEAVRLAAAHEGDIHLLVSDVVMPGMNGRDLAQELQKSRPALTPLFMSGHTADVIATRGLLAPDVAFLAKPFTPVALAAKVREVLARVRR